MQLSVKKKKNSTTYLSLFNGVKTLHGFSPPRPPPYGEGVDVCTAAAGLRRLNWIRFLLVVQANRCCFGGGLQKLPMLLFSLSSSECAPSSASNPRNNFFQLIDDGGVLMRTLLLLALTLVVDHKPSPQGKKRKNKNTINYQRNSVTGQPGNFSLPLGVRTRGNNNTKFFCFPRYEPMKNRNHKDLTPRGFWQDWTVRKSIHSGERECRYRACAIAHDYHGCSEYRCKTLVYGNVKTWQNYLSIFGQLQVVPVAVKICFTITNHKIKTTYSTQSNKECPITSQIA